MRRLLLLSETAFSINTQYRSPSDFDEGFFLCVSVMACIEISKAAKLMD
jgi:hypothetical protein